MQMEKIRIQPTIIRINPRNSNINPLENKLIIWMSSYKKRESITDNGKWKSA